MPWNGSGVFNRIFSWVADKAAGLDIIASRMDTDTNDLASNGFGNCLTRDGQGTPTANLPMNNFRHTGASNGVAATDYATVQQLKNGNINFPSNLQINASVGSNLLTVSLKSAASGSDATASDPIYIPFRDVTITNGDPVVIALTSALSISTFATGATFATTNGTPFRLWLVAFNNGGTIVLGLINCSGGGNIFCPNEGALASSTAMSGAATNSSIFYTPNGTTITSKAIRILGYVEYANGLATAGTYASVPTSIVLFGPGVKKPGDTVQLVFATGSSNTSCTSTVTNTNMNVGSGITVTSRVNWVMIDIMFGYQVDTSTAATFTVSRNASGAGPDSVGVSLPLIGNGPGMGSAILMKTIDPANAVARSSYNLFCILTAQTGGTSKMQVTGSQSIVLMELMG